MKRNLFLVLGVMICLSLVSASAYAIVLPEPTIEVDGIPLASHYGDFYTYPTSLMPLLGYSELDISPSAGTGKLDVLVYTGSNGAKNNPVDGGFVFQDPLAGSKGNGAGSSTFFGNWGDGPSTERGPVLVKDLLAYLQHFDASYSVPVFGFDMSESQTTTTGFLNVKAMVQILDGDGSTVLKSWTLADALNPDSQYVYAPQSLTLTGLSSATYAINNNRGGGKMDYLVFAPDMDLTPYADLDNIFRVHLDFKDLNAESEEIFIMGRVGSPPPQNVVPEPASMILMGIGLAGAMLKKRQLKVKS